MLGVSRQSVHDLVLRKIIERGTDGRIDVDLAKHAIASRVRPSGKTAAAVQTPPPAHAAAPEDGSAITSYHVAKTLREATEAKIAQLKLAEMRGDLVRADDVRHELQKKAAGLREAFLQLPSRVIPLLAAEHTPAAMDAILRAEIVLALQQIEGMD